jgi:energy-coupling factor transporter ATP-binding protein EcfA2
MQIELKNYRAFEDSKPVTWRLQDGFVAFVGANNSGKSSLLRFFHEARPAFIQCSGTDGLREHLMGRQIWNAQFESVADLGEVFCNRNDRDMTATFVLDDIQRQDPTAVRLRWERASRQLNVEVEVEGQPVKAQEGTADGTTFEVADSANRRWRIDLSRFAAEFQELSEAIYLGPFRNAVNVGGNSEYYDLAIGEKFIERWDLIKTGNDRNGNRAAIAVEREIEAIFDIDRLEINAAPGNSTLQVIADGEPYQLQEHGAGLAQFVVVLAFVAIRRPTYILIDEPELNLHPSLQLDFLTTLARYCRRGVAFATHSIGLARAMGEQVYSVRRPLNRASEVRELPATRDFVEFLGELSLSGYSELGFDRVLMVEGATDVPVVQQWLRCYGIEHRVVLLPLGGATLINATSAQALSEIRRIAGRVSVLIDSEKNSEDDSLDPGRAAFVEECEKLGFDVHVMQRRASENYLSDSAVKAIKGPKYRALDPFEKLADPGLGWAKRQNWRIAAQMDRADLEATDLGGFFLSLTVAAEQA